MKAGLKRLHRCRQSVYGPWVTNMAGTSQQLAGLLTQMLACGAARIDGGGVVHLPDWAAPLFMTAVKLNRIAAGRFKADSFDDLLVYLDFVRVLQKKRRRR